MLAPLKAIFKHHGAYLLKLPSKAVRPGSLLTSNKTLFQDLIEVDELWGGGEVLRGPETAAHFLLDQITTQSSGGGSLGAGLPKLASLSALGSGSSDVTVQVRGITTRRLMLDGKEHHSSDWLDRFNAYRDIYPLQAAMDGMKLRKAWWPSPRAIDIVQATVHVQELVFTTESRGDIKVEGEIEKALPVDLKAGFDVQWLKTGELVWAAESIPIGFLPVRYAWAPWRGRFVAARV